MKDFKTPPATNTCGKSTAVWLYQLSHHWAFILYRDDYVVLQATLLTWNLAPVILREKGKILGLGFPNQQMLNNSVEKSTSFPKYLSRLTRR